MLHAAGSRIVGELGRGLIDLRIAGFDLDTESQDCGAKTEKWFALCGQQLEAIESRIRKDGSRKRENGRKSQAPS